MPGYQVISSDNFKVRVTPSHEQQHETSRDHEHITSLGDLELGDSVEHSADS